MNRLMLLALAMPLTIAPLGAGFEDGGAAPVTVSWYMRWSRSTVISTTFSPIMPTSSRVGLLAISSPWLMIAIRSQSCSASSR